ncbi:monocarboxylate transporter 5 [Caerostris extrusa]|uniref:Monocarboxylate transporter 5 n=1 Tax=Caerostris extrusa TaxID=172846 RepID=A0AAV4X5T1_CAEEX|nr:monocarboxylate transporter 5 [Caerostris extrusa]
MREDTPDSARAWAVALAVCFINALQSGLMRASGLLYVALIDTYGGSRAQASLPFSVRNIVKNLSGPFVGALGQRLGTRKVTLVGGVFASLGVLFCSFAPSIMWITFLWGGMHALGACMVSILSLVLVTQFFVKHRATASGLAFSGSCFGSLLWPLLMECLLLNMGLTGAFLVTGGILLNVLPASLILKEPSWSHRQKKVDAEVEVSNPKMNVVKKQSFKNGVAGKDSENVFIMNFKQRHSFSKEEQKQDVGVQDTCNLIHNAKVEGFDNLAFDDSTIRLKEDGKTDEKCSTVSPSQENMKNSSSERHQQETSIHKAFTTIIRDPLFYMISLSLAAFAMVFDPFFTIIVDYMMDKGVEEGLAKYFITALAFGDLVGRLCFGWVTDKKLLSVPKFMMSMQIAQGAFFLTLPLIHGFYPLMGMVIAFGLITGACLVMFPVLVTNYLQSVQSLAMGCISFLTGIMTMTVPPLIGYFRDQVGSYDGLLFLTGGASVVVGFLWIFEPFMLKCRNTVKE